MHRLVLAAALAALTGLGAAQAATVTPFGNDADFLSICKGCVIAEAELRGGNARTDGDYELDVRPGGQFGANPAQAHLTSGRPETFALRYDGAGTLSLMLGEFVYTEALELYLDRAKSLFIRVSSRNRGSLALDYMTLQADKLHDLGRIAPRESVEYLAVGGFDFTKAFSLVGDARFDFPSPNLGSHLAAQFKFTDVDLAPVPVPAAGLMLGGALGALGLARRRRKAA